MPEENKVLDIKDYFNFSVEPINENFNSSSFKKLNIPKSQQGHIDMLVSQFPQLNSASTLKNAYAVKFPDGINTGHLMPYRNGGVGTPIQGDDGKIIAHASLHELKSQAVVLGAFSAMSIATGQYFLSEINSKLDMLNQEIDKVLDFLYGDKKAELLSEINFVQYAHKNFSSIMQHEDQRIATISGLQAAKKVAMKDIEFYMCDLDAKANTSTKSYNDFYKLSEDSFLIKDSLELSTQLYVMSSLMECFYAQNTDTEYINEVKNSTLYYINKCNSRILSDFSKLNGHNNGFKQGVIKKVDTEYLDNKFKTVISALTVGEDSQMRKVIDTALNNALSIDTYYMNNKGEVFISA